MFYWDSFMCSGYLRIDLITINAIKTFYVQMKRKNSLESVRI